MKMADYEIVDPFQTGQLGRRVEALGIPPIHGPSGIDQHRFTGMRHDQRRAAPPSTSIQ